MAYINKSYREYSKLSRYEPFPYYYDTDNKKYVYGRTSYLDDSTAYTVHITRKDDTLDALALYYYGNPTYYWVIADFNRLQDCYSFIPENTQLKIPSLVSIQFNG